MSKNNNISNQDEFLSEEILLKYINNELSDNENKRIELIIQENEIYSDIIDGLLMMDDPENIVSEKKELNKKIDTFSRNKRRQSAYKYHKYRSIAAVILVLMVSTGVFLFMNNLEKNSENNPIAKFERKKLKHSLSVPDEDMYVMEDKESDRNTLQLQTDIKEKEYIEKYEKQIIESLTVIEDDIGIADINISTQAKESSGIVMDISIPESVEIEYEYIEPIAFAIVEEKPLFPGGDAALFKFIAENIVYPPTAKEMGISGKVYVQFVIDKYGKVTQVKVVKGIDPELDAEAVRVVSKIPDWLPGKQRNINVPVQYILPINFRLK